MLSCRLSYYSLLPRLSHLSFGVLGACSLRSKGFRDALVSHCAAFHEYAPSLAVLRSRAFYRDHNLPAVQSNRSSCIMNS